MLCLKVKKHAQAWILAGLCNMDTVLYTEILRYDVVADDVECSYCTCRPLGRLS